MHVGVGVRSPHHPPGGTGGRHAGSSSRQAGFGVHVGPAPMVYVAESTLAGSTVTVPPDAVNLGFLIDTVVLPAEIGEN